MMMTALMHDGDKGYQEMFSLALAMAPQAQQWFSDHPQFPRLTGEALRSIKPKYHKGGPKKRKRGQSD